MESASQLRSHDDVPAAMPHTGFGFLARIAPQLVRGRVDFIFDAWRRHGDLYELRLGPLKVVMVNHPEHVGHILRGQARKYEKGGPMWEALRTLLGDGLVTSDGDVWRRRRRMLQPHFARDRLADLVPAIAEAVTDEFERAWPDRGRGTQVLDMEPAFSRMTMSVVVKAMFGMDLRAEDADDMVEALSYVVHQLVREMMFDQLPDKLPFPHGKRYRAMLARLDDYLFRTIASRRSEGAGGHDLLSMLCRARDDVTGKPLTERQIRDEVATFFVAGYETTASSVAWTAYLLATHPDIQARVRAEAQGALESARASSDGPPGNTNLLSRLPYTGQVLHEGLRLYPPSYFFPRSVATDDVIDGIPIPAGRTVFLLPLTVHRHPDFWPDPERFDPARFEAGRERHPTAWIPFGSGQRHCIGREFAVLEAVLIMAGLVERYHLRAVPARPAQMGLSTTLRSRDGVWVELRPNR